MGLESGVVRGVAKDSESVQEADLAAPAGQVEERELVRDLALRTLVLHCCGSPEDESHDCTSDWAKEAGVFDRLVLLSK